MAALPPSLAEVAAAAGVSKATASKALCPNPGACDIAAATRARVRAAAAALGWRRGARARLPRSGAARTLALVYGRAAPYLEGVYDRVPQALAGEASARGYQLLFVPLAGGATWRAQLRAQRIAAAVLIHPVPAALEDELAADGFPCAVLNHDGAAPLPRVLADDAGAVAAALAHLHAHGHRRIAWVRCTGGDRTVHHSVALRAGAYRAWMAAHGLATCELLHSFDDQVRDFRLHAWLRRGEASAVLAYGAEDALRVRLAAAECGIAVPRQLSLAACHDRRELAWHLPAITAAAVPMEAMARRAAAIALDRLEGRDDGGARRELLPAPLAVRGSVAPPRRNPGAKRAARG
ncbi:MAG: substrate-binding domain-containing protein [Planctomycetes bacterium]|nr:substrate-binding domain-containing protein [Planctomycetota bacterium]